MRLGRGRRSRTGRGFASRSAVRAILVLFVAASLPLDASGGAGRQMGDAYGGDPVSLGTGIYVRADDDLSIEGTGVALTRTYRTQDPGRRPFGIGASHSFNLYLVGDGRSFQWVDLILADGGRIHFHRVTGGNSISDAAFEHTGSPTEFYGSLLRWTGTEWHITLGNGGRYRFTGCRLDGREVCRLLEVRDTEDGLVTLRYDAATGDLGSISAGDGRITLAYDDSHRIVAAHDSRGTTMAYEYDSAGHLGRALRSDGRLQEYTYGARHEVLTIREPDRKIVNSYDSTLRCIGQSILRGPRGQLLAGPPERYEFGYRTDAGEIVETRVTEPDGTLRIATFNGNGYLATDTSDPGGPHFVRVVYARDSETNLAPSVTVQCAVRGRIVEASSPVGPAEHPDLVRLRLVGETCR